VVMRTGTKEVNTTVLDGVWAPTPVVLRVTEGVGEGNGKVERSIGGRLRKVAVV